MGKEGKERRRVRRLAKCQAEADSLRRKATAAYDLATRLRNESNAQIVLGRQYLDQAEALDLRVRRIEGKLRSDTTLRDGLLHHEDDEPGDIMPPEGGMRPDNSV
jgi:hypothetical protein